MDIVREKLAQHGKTVFANIHDVIVVMQCLSSDAKREIELRMQQQTTKPYWRLGLKQVHGWAVSLKGVRREEELHQQWITVADVWASRCAVQSGLHD